LAQVEELIVGRKKEDKDVAAVIVEPMQSEGEKLGKKALKLIFGFKKKV
jgi:4-aminobutyrate aminotransferase-like enzyme